MPRVKLAENKEEQANKELMAIISKYLTLRGITKRDLAHRISAKESTLYSRCRNPGDFRREELMKIFSALHVSDEDKHAIQW